MVLVKKEYVIRYSSQDPIYKTENLLDDDGPSIRKPWLCSREDKSGQLEAEFQLTKASRIDYIDIGNFGCSTIEVLVGKSSYRQKTDYISILPTSVLLTLDHIKSGGGRSTVHMFDKNQMIENVAKEEWDQVKVILCQPYDKKKQFGLSFFALRNTETSILHIKDSSIIDKTEVMPSECLSEDPPPDAETSMTRGQQMLKASQSKQTIQKVSPVNRIEKIDEYDLCEQLNEDIANFFVAVADEIEDGYKSLKDFIKEFEQQCQRSLTLMEKEFFHNQYINLFNNGGQVEVKSRKRPAEVYTSNPPFVVDLTNKMPKPILLQKVLPRKEGKQAKTTNTLLQGQTSYNRTEDFIQPDGIQPSTSSTFGGNPDIFIQPDGSQPSTSSSFVDNHDIFIQPDGMKPSTSTPFVESPDNSIESDGEQTSTFSGFTFVECPICGESFPSFEVAEHAATCGDIPEIPEDRNEDYFKCPLCKQYFPESKINSHAEICLY